MTLTARTFTASLKPAWTPQKMADICNKMKGVATVYIINHDSDTDEDGKPKETHTHIMLDYETPRKLTTVANLLEVEPNFVETVKSTKAMLKYLTHQDEPEKHQYSPDEVITNSAVPYADMILGQSMSDREIAKYLVDGRGVELLGVVPATKLRTIQAFLQFDRSGQMLSQLEMVNRKLTRLEGFVDTVEQITKDLSAVASQAIPSLAAGIMQIAAEIAKVREMEQDRGRAEQPQSKGPLLARLTKAERLRADLEIQGMEQGAPPGREKVPRADPKPSKGSARQVRLIWACL